MITDASRKSVILIVVFLVCCAAIILVAASLGTEYWLTENTTVLFLAASSTSPLVGGRGPPALGEGSHPASPTKSTAGPSIVSVTAAVTTTLTPSTPRSSPNSSHGLDNFLLKEFSIDNYANINIGLFNGFVDKKRISSSACGFSVSSRCILNYPLWVVSVIFFVLSILFATIGAVFAAINATMTPIEEITGLAGLYLWNGLAGVFTLAGVLCYAGLCYTSLEHIQFKNNWLCGSTVVLDDKVSSSFGYSFYIPIGVIFLFVANSGLVFLAASSLGASKKPPIIYNDDDHNKGVIMLF